MNLLSPVISASAEILSHRPFVCPILERAYEVVLKIGSSNGQALCEKTVRPVSRGSDSLLIRPRVTSTIPSDNKRSTGCACRPRVSRGQDDQGHQVAVCGGFLASK